MPLLAESCNLRFLTDIRKIMQTIKIFVSYSWKPESRAVVDKIQAALRAEGIEIQRDINVLTFKGKIQEFMQLIGKGQIVLLIIGKDYLEGENCMYELMQIAAQGDIYERIVPIYLPSADIHKVLLRAKYVDFWVKKHEEILSYDKNILVNIPQEDINLYRDISQKIGNLMTFLANINALSLEMHEESNWKDLINTVKSMMKKLEGETMTNPTTNNNSVNQKPKSDNATSYEEFVKKLLDLIAEANYAEVIDELNVIFDVKPNNTYSTVRQNIMHQLNQGYLPNPAQVQALQMFVKGSEVKKRLT